MIDDSKIFNSFDSYFETHNLKNVDSSERILVVAGNRSFHTSGAADKVKKLLQCSQTFLFQDFTVNPKIEDAVRGGHSSNQ